MIELYLSSDGKHTVHVSADTNGSMDTLKVYAMELYAEVLSKYGTKPQLWAAAQNAHAPTERRGTKGRADDAPVPKCPEHQTPLQFRKGRYGDFWSCPTKLSDGTWCKHSMPVNANHMRRKRA